MGSSTTTLQSVADLMTTQGSLSVAQAAGGYSLLTWLSLFSDVANDLISEKFNWKWNSFRLPSILTNSYQTDYATILQNPIGWLENGMWTDINSTQRPKPRYPVQVVRQLQPTSWAGSPVSSVCWMYNSTLEQGLWPGAGMTYWNPIGVNVAPSNPPTNIRDARANILVLTTYGITGTTAPLAALAAAPGVTVTDGTCVWTVADPNAQGFRIFPMPPQSSVTYQLDLVAQMAPPAYTSLSQTLGFIPDDYANTFRAGAYAYCHKYSNDPNLKRDFLNQRRVWLESIMGALKEGDREQGAAGFIAPRSAMAGGWTENVGPANPYGAGWPGR
jgi:hypothetical protein